MERLGSSAIEHRPRWLGLRATTLIEAVCNNKCPASTTGKPMQSTARLQPNWRRVNGAPLPLNAAPRVITRSVSRAASACAGAHQGS